MTIQTNITTNRKALANRISEELLSAPVAYAGAPSFAYRVGACVTIDREGNIEITNVDAMKILTPFFIEQGWRVAQGAAEPTVDSEANVTPTDEEPTVGNSEVLAAKEDLKAPTNTAQALESTPTTDAYLISIPAEMTVMQLMNLTHMLYSEQHLLNKAAMDGRLTIPDSLITRLKDYTPETPEAFSDLLNDFKALGELTGFGYGDGIITLDFPYDDAQPDRWTAYAGLVGRIIHAAKAAHRVKAELQDSENEKYYMRAWLLRLGYGGADLKKERRLLLRNLKGHSAFPTDAAAIKHREKYAALRRTNQEVSADAK